MVGFGFGFSKGNSLPRSEFPPVFSATRFCIQIPDGIWFIVFSPCLLLSLSVLHLPSNLNPLVISLFSTIFHSLLHCRFVLSFHRWNWKCVCSSMKRNEMRLTLSELVDLLNYSQFSVVLLVFCFISPRWSVVFLVPCWLLGVSFSVFLFHFYVVIWSCFGLFWIESGDLVRFSKSRVEMS